VTNESGGTERAPQCICAPTLLVQLVNSGIEQFLLSHDMKIPGQPTAAD
jgi:hypothetical protein